MFSRFFSFNQSAAGKNNNNKSNSHSFSVDKIRVIVFQDTGDKLKLPLFDTKVPYKSHAKTYSSSSSLSTSDKHSYSKPGSLSLIYKTPRRYSHYGNDKHSQSWTSNEFNNEHSPIYKKRSNHNFELLGEIMFGTAPIAYKGVITKVHLLKIPQPQIVWTKLFSISAFDEEVSMIKNDSILNKSSSEYSMSYGSLRYFQQKDYEFNQPLIGKNFYNVDTSANHHGLNVASNNNFSSQPSSPSTSFNSGKSSSTINLSQRRSKRFNTSLTMENLKSATSSNTDKSIDSISSEVDLQNNTQALRRSRRRRILYAIGVVIDTELEPVFREFFFTHFIILENHIQILYETLVDTICSAYRKNQSRSNDSNKGGQDDVDDPQMPMLPPYAIQKNAEFLAAVERFQNSICELYCSPRIQKPLWLTMMTFPGEKKSCCNILISEFCRLINKLDIKKTGFFLSKVLTSVLVYHISWVTTVASSMYTESKDKRKSSKQLNPYLEQLSNLYGNLGTKKISRTIITGNQDKHLIQKLLYILTYFIRCSELHEHIEYIQNLNRQESYCSSIRSDSLLSTFSNSAASLNQTDQLDSKFRLYAEPDVNGYKSNRNSTLSMNVNINVNVNNNAPLEETTSNNSINKESTDKSIDNTDQESSDSNLNQQSNIGISNLNYQNSNTVKHSMLTEKLILSSDINLSKLAESEAKKNLTKELVSVPLPKTLITRTVPDCFADEYLRYNPVTMNPIPQNASESVNIPINSNQSKKTHGLPSLNDNSNSYSHFDSSYTTRLKHLSANDIHLVSPMVQEFQTNNHLQQYIPKLTPKSSQMNLSPISSPVNSFSPSFSQSSSSPSLSISPMSIYDNKGHQLSSSPSVNQHISKSSNCITPNDQLQYRSFGRSLLADYCSNGYQSDFALMGCSRFSIERIKRDLEASIRYSYFSKSISHSTCIIADVDNYQCHIIECILDDSVEVDNEIGIDDLENEELRKYHLDNDNNKTNNGGSLKGSNSCKNSMQNNVPSIEINSSKVMKNNSNRNSNHRYSINNTNNNNINISNGRYLSSNYRMGNHSNASSFDDNKISHENSCPSININNINSSGIPINIKSSNRSSLNLRRNHDYHHNSCSPYESTSLSLSYNRRHQAQVFIPTITSNSNSSSDLSPLKFRIDRPQASNFIIKMLTELKGLYNSGLPPETCTMFIEDQLKALCYESILVASFLKDKKELLDTDLIKTCSEVGLDTSDIPLITSILSINDERYLRIKNTNISPSSSFSSSSKKSGNSNSYKDYSSSFASSLSSSLLNQRFSTRLKQKFSQH
ncbi:hypothetical protein BCR32DRAFT_265453 [Anaeromyces robustus]|uniref:UDENN FNIP1/2-type domain-containing protein n=1 Tax=Anaeromyces robustus TaxID=1754192 RepID=A0A1Y1XK26_9FUNG|nr:hypothetical protein BCR32DRAFT_265453 [Anaeromyces robustus]|eukprot:ORX85704.1 hypothetical protein BCR32DRAFT_265453 [Anaeromyces robustus]